MAERGRDIIEISETEDTYSGQEFGSPGGVELPRRTNRPYRSAPFSAAALFALEKTYIDLFRPAR